MKGDGTFWFLYFCFLGAACAGVLAFIETKNYPTAILGGVVVLAYLVIGLMRMKG